MQNNNFIVDNTHGEPYNNILYFTLEKRESLEHLWKFRINKDKFNRDFDKFVKFCREITKKTATELNKYVENKETLLPILEYSGNNPKKLEIQAKLKEIMQNFAEMGLFPLKRIVKYNHIALKKNITGYAILATSTYSNQPHDNNTIYEHPRVSIVEEESKEYKKISWEMQPPKRKAIRKRQYTKKRGPSTNNKYFTIDTRGAIKEDEAMGTIYNAERNNNISKLLEDL